jgi:hypothetical protein
VPLRRREVALLLALAVALLLLAAVPGLNAPFARLAAYEGDGREPMYDADVDAQAVRRAGELVPDDARYYLDMPHVSPLLAGNVKAAAQLFLSPALPVRDPRAAGWVLHYGGEGFPPGLRPVQTTRLAPGIAVVRVRPG